MRVTKVHIEKFRGFRDIEFNLGTHLTAIAGQNGTQKTTLLGILSQPFALTEKTNPMVENKEKPLSGGNYKSGFDEKFKLSAAFDRVGNHEWTLYFDKEDDGFTIESIHRNKKKDPNLIRFWKKGDRSKGSGYVQLPVIYLSLLRLFPIGEDEDVIENQSITLSEEEFLFYKTWHNKILKITRDELTEANYLASKIKNTLGANTEYYDWRMNSAGQDNIGKIILSILSFKRLKENYPEDYKGGILVIDELETTLYPAAQIALIEFLIKFAVRYNIQVIFTTHSLTCLEKLCELQDNEKRRNQVRVIFLEKRDNSIELIDGINFFTIQHKLNVTLEKSKPQVKINTFTEDEECKVFAKAILKSGRTKYLNFLNLTMGCNGYIELVRTNVLGFTYPESLIILDGDVNSKPRTLRKIKNMQNVIVLPVDKSPERELAAFLYNLSDASPYWNKIKEGYTHQICFGNIPYEEVKKEREKAKKWFNEQKEYWGRGCVKLINLWIKENQEEVDAFRNQFDGKIEQYLKLYGKTR